MKKLLIATHNPAKREELTALLKQLLDPQSLKDIQIVTLDDIGISEDVEETGATFEENAVRKARYFHKKSGLPTLSDDGGLEIDYLGGAPGVKSKRWIGGVETSDRELIDYTFKQMDGVPKGKRSASFSVVLAYVSLDGKELTAKGSTRGVIADKPLDKHFKKGFPFRQVLFLPEIGKYYNGDQMTDEEQERYNHRRQALEQLIDTLTRDFITS